MNRREFVVGSLALSAGQNVGMAAAESGPLTKIIFPFAAGGSGDMLCRLLANFFRRCLIAASSSRTAPAVTG
jgi:tripartite-type tricarboxylate transporter receptor subunit TctC